jgi:hypothetical protein
MCPLPEGNSQALAIHTFSPSLRSDIVLHCLMIFLSAQPSTMYVFWKESTVLSNLVIQLSIASYTLGIPLTIIGYTMCCFMRLQHGELAGSGVMHA